MAAYLLMQNLEIHNANAMSSTLTIGVPAMTAWLGAAHALERNVTAHDGLKAVRIPKVAVSYHQTDLQVYRGSGDYVNSIIGTANPLNEKGERPSFIEEPRIHLNVSLLLRVQGLNGDTEEVLLECVRRQLPFMKFAGGDLINVGCVKALYADEEDERSERKIIASLMPGFVIVERSDLLTEEEREEDALDALINFLAVQNEAVKSESGKVLEWKKSKRESGWLVPVAVGFKGLSPLGKVEKQRDPNMLHRFVEPVVTLGEFKMPYRFTKVEDMMWHYEYDEGEQLYLCKNQK
ncbi:type I-F CRISPR-associated protein Csy2 [Colibacter massiliensis]|uniref:type I-F CRISPR-associated protein Csy2 n=1 Tax=Colibacter massiliensis TaxID=1852379 RepID=UPI00266BA7F3|nr:type I-F CRISPR-associated protein Csy2 [Colibacter massiliensis]